jgi:hypothetical protein
MHRRQFQASWKDHWDAEMNTSSSSPPLVSWVDVLKAISSYALLSGECIPPWWVGMEWMTSNGCSTWGPGFRRLSSINMSSRWCCMSPISCDVRYNVKEIHYFMPLRTSTLNQFCIERHSFQIDVWIRKVLSFVCMTYIAWHAMLLNATFDQLSQKTVQRQNDGGPCGPPFRQILKKMLWYPRIPMWTVNG